MSRKVVKYFVSLAVLAVALVLAVKLQGNQERPQVGFIQEQEAAVQVFDGEVHEPEAEIQTDAGADAQIAEDGSYTDAENVALYIHTYGKLPQNYITKKEAEALGWESGTAVSNVAPGKSIGGDRFGNYEKLLPAKKGRTYYECDIDAYAKKSRGTKRIVFSDDGLVYYTQDHYQSFELLYGEE